MAEDTRWPEITGIDVYLEVPTTIAGYVDVIGGVSDHAPRPFSAVERAFRESYDLLESSSGFNSDGESDPGNEG